jgi:hypothetical protein
MITVELWREDTGDISAYLRQPDQKRTFAAQAPTAAEALQKMGEMLDAADVWQPALTEETRLSRYRLAFNGVEYSVQRKRLGIWWTCWFHASDWSQCYFTDRAEAEKLLAWKRSSEKRHGWVDVEATKEAR